LFFQTWGLIYTSATKSTFITCLYVILVPIFERVFLNRKLSPWHLFYAAAALVGLLILADAKNFSSINFGDFLTFLCAILSALHILVLSKLAPNVKSPFALNTWQCLWAAMPMVVLMLLFPPDRPDLTQSKVLAGIAFLSLFSSLIAFWLMVRAQR